jgi:predicted permease
VEAARDTVKHALRGIGRSPALSAGIVLAFALGIGASATMYRTIERLLLRPPPHIESPDGVRRLLVHRRTSGEAQYAATVSYPDVQDFARTSGFASVAPYATRSITLGRGEAAAEVEAVLVGADYWRLLGVRPALGRLFTPAENAIGAAPTAVLSWSRWQRDYGGRVDVLGETIDFGHGPYTIIGVTPKGFTGIDLQRVDLFLPLMVAGADLNGGDLWTHFRAWYWLRAVARISPGVSVEAAEAQATSHHRSGRAESTDDPSYDPNATVMAAPMLVAQGPNAPAEASVAKWLLGVAAVVLLIACLNVANLLLARTLRQRHETFIRLALGVSRKRLIAQMLVEGVLLGLLGGAAALLLAAWGGTIVQTMLFPDVEWSGSPTPSMLFLILTLSIFSGLASAAIPAVQASRRDVADGLRTAPGGITRSSARARVALSMVQVVFSVLLLVGAGLFVRSLWSIRSADFGVDLWNVAYVQPVFVHDLAEEESFSYYEDAVERVRRVPGVAAVAAANSVPFRSAYSTGKLRAEGIDSLPHSSTGKPLFNAVGTDYFRVLGMEIERGRAFDERDTRTSQPVAIVNRAMARALWPSEDAIGKCLFIGSDDPPCTEIVGIAENSSRGNLIEEDYEYQYYLPLQQRQLNRSPSALLIRISGEMQPVLSTVQRALLDDPRVRWVQPTPMEDLVAGELRQWRLGAALFTLFGAIALIVAAIGLYSVLAFEVAQRVREIGLRGALGASRASILSLILARAVRITAAGIGIGALLALLLAPRLQDMLYHVEPRDPLTFLVVAGGLGLVSLCAAGLPAWRATRVDPTVALRT